jgi:G:T-mismatch repair DNA endonuclease (very short patch repair protein)
MNPLQYNANDYNKSKEKYACDVWKYDNDRKNTLEYEGYNVIIVWENDFKMKKQDTIKSLFKQIEDLLLL